MVSVAERPEFEEIPEHVRDSVEEEVRMAVFDVLHAEAVKRGDIAAPPNTHYDGRIGRVLRLVLSFGFGAIVGSMAVIVVLFTIRSFATVV